MELLDKMLRRFMVLVTYGDHCFSSKSKEKKSLTCAGCWFAGIRLPPLPTTGCCCLVTGCCSTGGVCCSAAAAAIIEAIRSSISGHLQLDCIVLLCVDKKSIFRLSGIKWSSLVLYFTPHRCRHPELGHRVVLNMPKITIKMTHLPVLIRRMLVYKKRRLFFLFNCRKKTWMSFFYLEEEHENENEKKTQADSDIWSSRSEMRKRTAGPESRRRCLYPARNDDVIGDVARIEQFKHLGRAGRWIYYGTHFLIKQVDLSSTRLTS